VAVVVVAGLTGSAVVAAVVVGGAGWGGRTETFETCCVVGGTAGTGWTGVSSTGGAISMTGAVAIGGWVFAFAAASSVALGRGVSVVVGWAAETITCGTGATTGAAGTWRRATAGRAARTRDGAC
jgi:hypothetical protein